MDMGVLGGGLCAARPLLLAQPQRREQGSGLSAVVWSGANVSVERRIRLRINPANETSGLVCVPSSSGQGDGV